MLFALYVLFTWTFAICTFHMVSSNCALYDQEFRVAFKYSCIWIDWITQLPCDWGVMMCRKVAELLIDKAEKAVGRPGNMYFNINLQIHIFF